jgi:hypothetical protein
VIITIQFYYYSFLLLFVYYPEGRDFEGRDFIGISLNTMKLLLIIVWISSGPEDKYV